MGINYLVFLPVLQGQKADAHAVCRYIAESSAKPDGT